MKARTAQANQIRGLLTEYGMVLPQGIVHIEKMLSSMLADMHNALPGFLMQLFQTLLDNFSHLDQLAQEIENAIRRWHLANEESRRLEPIPGIGSLTATALVAPSVKQKHSTMSDSSQPGLVLFRDSTPLAVRSDYSASASAATPICASCSSTAAERSFVILTDTRDNTRAGSPTYLPAATRMSSL